MVRIRTSRPEDVERAVEIWRAAVDATHDFLTPEDRSAIDDEVQAFLPQLSLWLALDADGRAVGFMSLEDGDMGALFIDPIWRGKGVGRALVTYAVALHPFLTTTVNEQNAQALGFYAQMGFRPTGRSAVDDEGRPYPIVRLRRHV
jgi:putative acetyltransferase